MDNVICGHGPFLADRMVDLRPEVRRSRDYPFGGDGELLAVSEDYAGLAAVKALEVVHRRSIDKGIMVSGARQRCAG